MQIKPHNLHINLFLNKKKHYLIKKKKRIYLQSAFVSVHSYFRSKRVEEEEDENLSKHLN